MSPVEEYLSGEQAAEDARCLVNAPPGGPVCCPGLSLFGWRRRNGVWTEAWIRDGSNGLMVHYRPEGDRFIVSDLGEGLRAYAVRTGDIEYRALPDALPETGILQHDGRIFACVIADNAVCLDIAAADLPAAIVRVMLASYRLANLDPDASRTTDREQT